jgi:hypothetical protein
LPGDGCMNPNGLLPVIYTSQLSASMNAGSNSLTTTTAVFTPDDEGKPLVIPTAGTAMQGTGFTDYLLCNMHYDSGTSVTCFADATHTTPAIATTAVSGTIQLGRGNPHIVSRYSIAEDAAAYPLFGIDNVGMDLIVWQDYPENILYSGPAVKFGPGVDFKPTQFNFWTSNASPNNWAFAANSNSSAFYYEVPRLTLPSLSDIAINGIPTYWGDSPVSPPSLFGGGANNHPASTSDFIRATVAAQFLCGLCN